MGYGLPRFNAKRLGSIRLQTLLLAVVFCAAASSTPLLAQGQELWPLEIGNEWTYRLDQRIGAERITRGEMRARVTSTEKVGDTDTYVLTWYLKGNVYQKEYYAWRNGKLYVHKTLFDSQSNVIDPPKIVLDLLFSVGHRWTWTGYAGSYRGTEQNEVLSIEKITVAMGTYDAYKVRYVIQVLSTQATITRWYVEGIGYVREEDTSPGQPDIIAELTSFTRSSSQGPSMLLVTGVAAIIVIVVVISIFVMRKRRVASATITTPLGFMRMTCPNCGSEVIVDSQNRTCRKCGTSLV